MKSEIKSLNINLSPKERNFFLDRFFFCIVSFIILFITSVGHAQPTEQLYKSANEFYKSKQFDKALNNYKKIISQGYRNSEVYYNLGNCYYKLNRQKYYHSIPYQ